MTEPSYITRLMGNLGGGDVSETSIAATVVNAADLSKLLAERDELRKALEEISELGEMERRHPATLDTDRFDRGVRAARLDAQRIAHEALSKPQQTEREGSRADPKADAQTHHRGVWKP